MRVGLSTSLKAFTAFLMLGGAFDVYAKDGTSLAREAIEIAKLQAMVTKRVGSLDGPQKRAYDDALRGNVSLIEDPNTRQEVLRDVIESFKKSGVSTVAGDGFSDSGFDEEEEVPEPVESVSGWMSQMPVNDVYGDSSYSQSFSPPPPRQVISTRPASSGWSSLPSKSFPGSGGGGISGQYQNTSGGGSSFSQSSGWSSPALSGPSKTQAPSGWGPPPRQNDSFSQSVPSMGGGVSQSQYQDHSQDLYGSSGGGGQVMSSDDTFGDMPQYNSVPDSSLYGQDVSSDPMVQSANERPVNDVYGGDTSLGQSYDSSGYGSSDGMPLDQGYGQGMTSYDSSADMQQYPPEEMPSYSSELNDTQMPPYDPGVRMNGNLDGDVLNAAQEYREQQQQQIVQKPPLSPYQAPSQMPYQEPPQQVIASPLLTAPVQSAPMVMGASNQFTKMVSDPSNAAGNVQVALRDNNPATHLAFAQSFVDKNYAATTKVPLEKSGITLVGDGQFLYAKVGTAQTKLNITPDGMQMLRATMDYAAEYNRTQTIKTIINAGIFPAS